MELQTSRNKSLRKLVQAATLVTVVAAVYFSITDPSQGNTGIIMGGSLLMTAMVYAWSLVAVRLFVGQRLLELHGVARLALLVASPVIYIILMQSIGQLNAQDVLAVAPLAGVLYFYLVHASSARTNEGKTRLG